LTVPVLVLVTGQPEPPRLATSPSGGIRPPNIVAAASGRKVLFRRVSSGAAISLNNGFAVFGKIVSSPRWFQWEDTCGSKAYGKYKRILSTAALAALVSGLALIGQQQPEPKNWTAAEDHQNMMDQLGIKALRPARAVTRARLIMPTMTNPWPIHFRNCRMC